MLPTRLFCIVSSLPYLFLAPRPSFRLLVSALSFVVDSAYHVLVEALHPQRTLITAPGPCPALVASDIHGIEAE